MRVLISMMTEGKIVDTEANGRNELQIIHLAQ
jgi:hypothetical protein